MKIVRAALTLVLDGGLRFASWKLCNWIREADTEAENARSFSNTLRECLGYMSAQREMVDRAIAEEMPYLGRQQAGPECVSGACGGGFHRHGPRRQAHGFEAVGEGPYPFGVVQDPFRGGKPS
jgi:hypothetical protein